MAIEEWPTFTLVCHHQLTAIVLAPVVNLYLRPLVLLIFINMNLLDMLLWSICTSHLPYTRYLECRIYYCQYHPDVVFGKDKQM